LNQTASGDEDLDEQAVTTTKAPTRAQTPTLHISEDVSDRPSLLNQGPVEPQLPISNPPQRRVQQGQTDTSRLPDLSDRFQPQTPPEQPVPSQVQPGHFIVPGQSDQEAVTLWTS